MEFEKTVNLLTALMLYFIVLLPFEGYLILHASDSVSSDTPIAVSDIYPSKTLPFEKGQHFEFEISKPNLIGDLSYEIKKMSKDRILVSGIFTYYVIVQGKDGPTTLWDTPITLKKSFWIDGRTFRAQSQDYVAQLWNVNMGDSVTNHDPDTVPGFGAVMHRPSNIRKVNLRNVPETNEHSPEKHEKETTIKL